MNTMMPPPEVRTRTDEATDERRRTPRPSGAVDPTGTVRAGEPRTGAVRPSGGRPGSVSTGSAATPRTVRAPERRPVRTAERRATTAPQAPFAVLVVGLLGGALVGLLLLNTALAQQAFTQTELRRETQRLDERRQALQEEIAREDGPEVLRAKARRLGMRETAPRPVSAPRAGR
jgi:hypothetical protein